MGKLRIAIFALSFSAISLLTCACSESSDPDTLSICASVEEKEDVFRIFAGDIERAPDNYVQRRTEYLDSIADTTGSVDALICFNDYYTAQEIAEFAESYDVAINRAYMWPKGETGRLLLFVEDGNLEKSIDDYKLEIRSDDTCDDPDMLKDYQSFLDDKYGVFAVSLTAPAKTLVDMSHEADCISFVDVLYNAEAEEYAKSVGKPVSYLELPAKPDGVQ